MAGLANVRLHLLVQALTFVVFPLLYIPFKFAFGGLIPEGLMLGFLYLCALAVHHFLVRGHDGHRQGQRAGGDIQRHAVELTWHRAHPGHHRPGHGRRGHGRAVAGTGHAFNIATLLLLPFVLGQAARPMIGNLASRHKKFINTFDKLVILMLVYSSFCDSTASGPGATTAWASSS